MSKTPKTESDAFAMPTFDASKATEQFRDFADKGIEAHHIEDPDHLEEAWFTGKQHVGITAGTSTPQDVIEAVHARVRAIIAAQPTA